MTILVDIDDTIIQLLLAWVYWLNNKYNLNVDYKDINNWIVSSFFPSLTKEQVYEALTQEEIWKSIKPMPEAAEYLKKLIDNGNNIYLVTATDYRNVFPKFEYVIKKYFPFIGWNQVIVTANKQMIKADILIDDAPHNLINGDYVKILFSANHNKNSDIGIRVHSWEEAYKLIQNIADYKEVSN